MKRHIFVFLLIISLSCTGQAGREEFVRIFFPQGHEVVAELAVTEAQRQRGLMFRDELSENQAMLFVFETEGLYPFWMKNMKFPIDILWLDKDRKIVHIEAEVPACPRDPCPSYAPSQVAQYVLELRAGWAKRHGLRLYDRLEFILPSKLS